MWNLRSKLRRKLLAYFFANPTAQHYVRELAALLGVDPTNLLREMERLSALGLLRSERRGHQRYFWLNTGYPLYPELRKILADTIGVPAQLREALAHTPKVREAFVYGSFAQGREDELSDVDVMIVGSPDPAVLARSIRQLERRIGREINYTVYSPDEFRRRLAARDAFLAEVMSKPRLELVHGS